eukprot:5433515-Heterocapsa_arctica.AAC.2
MAKVAKSMESVSIGAQQILLNRSQVNKEDIIATAAIFIFVYNKKSKEMKTLSVEDGKAPSKRIQNTIGLT